MSSSNAAGRMATHQSLYRELIARLDRLHLEPGDYLTVEFPKELYESPAQLADAERFAQQVASLTRHQVIILREGTELRVVEPKPDIEIVATLDNLKL